MAVTHVGVCVDFPVGSCGPSVVPWLLQGTESLETSLAYAIHSEFGLVWFGLVWFVLVWFGLAWFGFGFGRFSAV